mmetsp:Transcript_7321/g.8036  ORF Transcript_7321/g.8036 Transcript_7321/m.8036 type:complete len:204 (-) Transcript_7321:83-694(-)
MLAFKGCFFSLCLLLLLHTTCVSTQATMATFTVFPAYTQGVVSEQILNIGKYDFVFDLLVHPTQYAFSTLVGYDSSGVAENQFRVQMHADGHIAVFGLNIEGGRGFGFSLDPAGYGTALTTPDPLPLNENTRVTLERSRRRMVLSINGVVVSETRQRISDHTVSIPARIGSRLPPGGGPSADVHFFGTIQASFYSPNIERINM